MTNVELQVFLSEQSDSVFKSSLPLFAEETEEAYKERKSTEDVDRFSVENLGRHDHGPLPASRRHDYFTGLRNAVAMSRQAAKEFLDELVIAETKELSDKKGSKECIRKQEVDRSCTAPEKKSEAEGNLAKDFDARKRDNFEILCNPRMI